METVVSRCAGLDVGKDEVGACVRVPDAKGGRRWEVRTFLKFKEDLEPLAD
jgi:transposase